MLRQAHAIISYTGDKTALLDCTVSYTNVPRLHHLSLQQGLLGSSPYVRHTAPLILNPDTRQACQFRAPATLPPEKCLPALTVSTG